MVDKFIEGALLLTVVLNLGVLAIINWPGSRHDKSSRSFSLAVVFVIFWAVGTALLQLADSTEYIATGTYMFYVSPILLVVSLLLFAQRFFVVKEQPVDIITRLVAFVAVGLSLYLLVDKAAMGSVAIGGAGTLNDLRVVPIVYGIYIVYFILGF